MNLHYSSGVTMLGERCRKTNPNSSNASNLLEASENCRDLDLIVTSRNASSLSGVLTGWEAVKFVCKKHENVVKKTRSGRTIPRPGTGTKSISMVDSVNLADYITPNKEWKSTLRGYPKAAISPPHYLPDGFHHFDDVRAYMTHYRRHHTVGGVGNAVSTLTLGHDVADPYRNRKHRSHSAKEFTARSWRPRDVSRTSTSNKTQKGNSVRALRTKTLTLLPTFNIRPHDENRTRSDTRSEVCSGAEVCSDARSEICSDAHSDICSGNRSNARSEVIFEVRSNRAKLSRNTEDHNVLPNALPTQSHNLQLSSASGCTSVGAVRYKRFSGNASYMNLTSPRNIPVPLQVLMRTCAKGKHDSSSSVKAIQESFASHTISSAVLPNVT